MAFTVAEGKIVEIDVIADPERVRRVAAAVLTDEQSLRPPGHPRLVLSDDQVEAAWPVGDTPT
jgi:hypothetical protein